MISPRVETLKLALLQEFSNQRFSQKKFWRDTFTQLIGHRIFVIWVDPKKISKSKVVRVVKATRHFAVCEELILNCEGVPRPPLMCTISYSCLIARFNYIEILSEVV